jgi:hypothetical protein
MVCASEAERLSRSQETEDRREKETSRVEGRT